MPDVPPDVDVRRSRRRLRTVTAYREGGRTVVLIPARFTSAQEQEWVRRMLARLSAQDRRRRPGDTDLAARAAELSRRYLGGLARPVSVGWAANQHEVILRAEHPIGVGQLIRTIKSAATDSDNRETETSAELRLSHLFRIRKPSSWRLPMEPTVRSMSAVWYLPPHAPWTASKRR